MSSAQAVPVLMYHHVSPSPGLITMTPDNFRAQMRWLAANGYRTISCSDLARFIKGEPLPAKSVLLTFDDGYLDNWVWAHPILAEFGLHAALFLITGRIGDGAARACAGAGAVPATPAHTACMEAVAAGRTDEVMLRWSEVERMAAAGTFEFHSHTHSHTRWDRSEADPAVRHAKLADDLALSRAALRQRLGSASTHLCWPQGYNDAGYRATAVAAGFSHLYTVARGTCLPHTPTDAIPRIVVKDKAGLWFASRMAIYRRPWLAALYDRLH